MSHKHHRYARPCVEIEYDQDALTSISCCGFVPVVLRVCGIDPEARLSVLFQRVRKQGVDQTEPYAYEVSPRSGLYSTQSTREYREYQATFFARAHPQETGTIHIQLESAVGSLLVDVSFRFDPRQDRPLLTVAKGHLQALRFLPTVRSAEAREALHGQYPLSVGGKTLSVKDPSAASFQSAGIQTIPLFSLDD